MFLELIKRNLETAMRKRGFLNFSDGEITTVSMLKVGNNKSLGIFKYKSEMSNGTVEVEYLGSANGSGQIESVNAKLRFNEEKMVFS